MCQQQSGGDVGPRFFMSRYVSPPVYAHPKGCDRLVARLVASISRQFMRSWVFSRASRVQSVATATATASEPPDHDPLSFANEIMAFQEREAKNTTRRAAFFLWGFKQ